MKVRSVLSTAVAVAMLATLSGLADAAPRVPGKSTERVDRALSRSRFTSRAERALPKGFVPAVAAQGRLHRYYVVMKSPAVAERISQSGGKGLSGAEQRRARQGALQSQEGAIRQARSQGGKIVFRYGTLVNAFSTTISPKAAAALAKRPDVASVQPVSIVRMNNETSVPFIGAPQVWSTFGVRGQGMTLALVDTGIDYTHADFGGSGDPADYENNDPNFIEPGTFPTAKVIGGYDFVGNNYDLFDTDPSNDIPRPDYDPLDSDGHGTHTGGTCCGIGVPGKIGPGVAPAVRIRAYKVWDEGNSTDDVLVAAYERAVDPNQDGDVKDRDDVLSFSGGVSYGTLNSVEAVAAQRVVDVGTVFVASAGNSGNQPSLGSAYITGTPATARGVIGVAASIDQFLGLELEINSSSEPVELPDNGLMVHQSWSPDLPSGGLTHDLSDANEWDPVDDPNNPTPADRQFCDAVGADLTDKVVLVYKGSTGAGDCGGSTKVFHAQNAGATAVILVSLFGGVPFGLGSSGEDITIPAVMISGRDGDAIIDVLSPPPAPPFNTGFVNATLHDDPIDFPEFRDAMTDFTSEGPARLTSDLKPDVSAPGFSITSAGVGTGDDSLTISGTSMAAPHVSGVAVLVKQRHPTWPPLKIKAAIMNQVTPFMKNNNLSTPVPATVMGAGRVKAFDSAKAVSLAFPASLSYGLEFAAGAQSETQRFLVRNYHNRRHHYDVSSAVRYSDFDPAIADVDVSLDGSSFGATRSFNLAPNKQRWVWVRLTLDPSVISPAEQLFGWYYFHPNVDGTVFVCEERQKNNRCRDTLRVPWHVAPLAASDNSLSEDFLDLTGGPATMEMLSGPAAGQPYGDLYLLGDTDNVESVGEEDIVAIGARSFTGSLISDGTPEGVPTGQDPLVGLTWQEFLSAGDEPTQPVEFGVQTAAVHNTTETLEVDVKIDAGADGVFADPDLMADFLVVKLPEAGGTVCVFDLSLPDPFDDCTHTYFPDYNNYNGNGIGVVVDAEAIGLSDAVHTLSYQVEACTGRFSGDVPGTFCDTAGGFDGNTYTSFIDVTNPALDIDPLVCQGFWNLGPPAPENPCDSGDPIDVAVGSAAPGDNPTILALFPNNAPSRNPTLVETET